LFATSWRFAPTADPPTALSSVLYNRDFATGQARTNEFGRFFAEKRIFKKSSPERRIFAAALE
jgi:hypothetical protein